MAFRNQSGSSLKALQIPECTIRWNDPALLDGKQLFKFPKGGVVPTYYEATCFHYAGTLFDAGMLVLGIKRHGKGLLQIGVNATIDYLDLTSLTLTHPIHGTSIRHDLQQWSPTLFTVNDPLKQAGDDTICVQSIGDGGVFTPIRGSTNGPPHFFMLFGDQSATFKAGDKFYFIGSGTDADGLYTLASDSVFEDGLDPKTILYTVEPIGAETTEPDGILFKRGMQATQGNGAIQTLVSQVVQIGQPVSF